MKNYCHPYIDPTDRAGMVNFLQNHFRYNTGNGWNYSTSYANNLKIYNLGLPKEKEDALWELYAADDNNEIYWRIDELIHNFKEKYGYAFQPAFNGRSGGYLVLYQGGIKDGKPYAYPIRSLDMDEDFDEWTTEELAERVKLVQDFDTLCNNIAHVAAEIADEYTVVEEEILVPRTVRRAIPKEE